ncbi:hypothetical protein FBUS_00018 [Fasciolopsis buskii]|uniref:Transmembrane protein n=1 Tax=Fasciolopsis buskii TaxID=27845 RepID=A0A8E0VF94_9TREM|nr:hypothetical protein FBUS_00018 [Fasciolopsis buski]
MSVSCSKCTVRFPCTVFVLFGILLLVGGSCVILIWAFVPNFSQAYPIGLQVGAVTCGSGVMVVISALITIYRWHSKMSRGATPGSTIHRKHGSHIIGKTHEFYIATPSSFSIVGDESHTRLKKAHSTAYISLGPSQAEKIKVLSLVHGFISATDLRRPFRTSVSLKSSTHSQSNSAFRNSSTVEPPNTSAILFSRNPDTAQVTPSAYCYKRFARDKSLRRSLPRVLIHPPVRRQTVHESHSQANLAETASKRLQADDDDEGVDIEDHDDRNDNSDKSVTTGQTDCENRAERGCMPSNLVPSGKYSVCSRLSTREVNFCQLDADRKSRRRLTRVLTTPPIGRASLFNLTSSECVSPSVWTHTGSGGGGVGRRGRMTIGSPGSNPSKTEHDSRSSLHRANSSKRVLLMDQGGQVISCTTLFGEELELDTSSSGGVGCRRLQACSGWNFFPVFVGHDQFASDEELEKRTTSFTNGTATNHSVHVSDAALSFTYSETEVSCAQAETLDKPATRRRRLSRPVGPLVRLRQLFKRIRTNRRAPDSVSITDPAAATSDVESGLQESLISATMPLAEPRMEFGANENTTLQSGSERPASAKDNRRAGDEESTTDVQTMCAPEMLNNASVFSLPAISPDLWTADRPVWVMGVPVTDGRWLATMDACDVILLREKQADQLDVVTGSSSSVYAFHVRPPSRLRPTKQYQSTRANHGRARSLGRILLSDKETIERT